MSQLLIRNDARLSVDISPDAWTRRDAALEQAALIGRVTNAGENEIAVAAQAALKSLVAVVEKDRKTVKQPVLDYGRAIDGAAKEFCAELQAELVRIGAKISDYAALELAKQRAAEAARRKELEETERRRQEERAKASSIEELDNIDARANEEAAALPAVQPMDKPKGQVIKEEWDFEVTDLWALARAHPGLVKIEPRRAEILDILRTGAAVTGVRGWKEVRATVRVSPQRQAIAV